MEFGADPAALAEVVRLARAATGRPIFVKLSPALPDIARSAGVAVDAGANGLTLVNTIPGLVIDVERRRPALGFGTGGVSGTALLPVGVLATWKVHRAVKVPLMGIGGVATARDALQYLLAGATLVGMGTAMFATRGHPSASCATSPSGVIVRACGASPRSWADWRDSDEPKRLADRFARARGPDRRARLCRRGVGARHGQAPRRSLPLLQSRQRAFHDGGPGDRASTSRGVGRRRLSRPQVPRHPEYGSRRRSRRGADWRAASDRTRIRRWTHAPRRAAGGRGRVGRGVWHPGRDRPDVARRERAERRVGAEGCARDGARSAATGGAGGSVRTAWDRLQRRGGRRRPVSVWRSARAAGAGHPAGRR